MKTQNITLTNSTHENELLLSIATAISKKPRFDDKHWQKVGPFIVAVDDDDYVMFGGLWIMGQDELMYRAWVKNSEGIISRLLGSRRNLSIKTLRERTLDFSQFYVIDQPGISFRRFQNVIDKIYDSRVKSLSFEFVKNIYLKRQ